ncbi:HSF1 [Bugula neritina]|uniref:HSF1 n=1 Tax=Bugula neritina TaxID=10212 RepID=A0A7J7K2M5_BUGNE|nr:HSF1 [Bugula neritina]
MDYQTLQLLSSDAIDAQNQNRPSTSVPAFLKKLRNLIDDPKNEKLISWDESGLSFHLHDQTAFAREILPKYFKHNNLASFVRQLNMYGFKKITAIDQGSLNPKDGMEFENSDFTRDEPEQMKFIKRKGSSIRERLSEYGALQPAQVNNVLVDVKDLKRGLQGMSAQLQVVKAENAALWTQMTKLRQKHEKQQIILNKLIQFMLTMANVPHKTKRHLPMIELGPSKQMKSSYEAEHNSDSSQTNSSGLSSSGNAGITIKDITDDDNTSILGGSQDLEIPSQDLEIPSTLVEVQSPPPPEYTSTVPVSNAVVAMPSTTPTRDPKLFKTQFSESVEDVQSDIDVLRDLFTNSDSLGLTPDTVSSLFEGEADFSPYWLHPTVNLDELIDGSEPGSELSLPDAPTKGLPIANSGAMSSDQQSELDGLFQEFNSGTDNAINDQTLKEFMAQPLVSDGEDEADKPIISSHDLD